VPAAPGPTGTQFPCQSFVMRAYAGDRSAQRIIAMSHQASATCPYKPGGHLRSPPSLAKRTVRATELAYTLLGYGILDGAARETRRGRRLACTDTPRTKTDT
jgi:hypothetical protein